MGVLYYKLGKDEAQFYDKSIKCYLKSIDVCPFPTTYQALANSYQKMNDTANSMKYHEMILQDDPINSTVLYNLACIENTTDKKDKAIEHLRTAIQYNSILKKNIITSRQKSKLSRRTYIIRTNPQRGVASI